MIYSLTSLAQADLKKFKFEVDARLPFLLVYGSKWQTVAHLFSFKKKTQKLSMIYSVAMLAPPIWTNKDSFKLDVSLIFKFESQNIPPVTFF